MLKEVGSEFWKQIYNNYNDIIPKCTNCVTLLSGRTCLDYIINDIKCIKKFNKILLPSYCCETMIIPFLENGVKVDFYKVDIDNIEYDENNDADAILTIDYFGYKNSRMEEIKNNAKAHNKITIYDATHKLNELNNNSDYVFCSFRKWFYTNHAIVVKNIGDFFVDIPNETNNEYIALRDRASDIKMEYINGNISDKNVYIEMFHNAEKLLETKYKNYAGIETQVDYNYITSRRRSNARYLLDKLSSLSEIKTLVSFLGENDCPLFVPIFLQNDKRNELKQYLIKHNIYCPNHWPISKYHSEYKNVFNKELSIICDQRYDSGDMQVIADTIRNYFNDKINRY